MYDLHGNLPAFEAVVDDAREAGVDRWLLGGDYGAYSPWPLEVLERLGGVTRAERRGESVTLVCSDSDAAIRALLDRHPEARDIEIAGAGLEEAFLELTR